MNGNYFCVSTGGFVSAAIRLCTRNHWNHAGIFTDRNIIQAAAQGAVTSSIDEYANPKYDEITNIHDSLTPNQRDSIVAKAVSLQGTPYGYLDIVALAIYSATGIRWRWLQRIVMREDRMICSQLVATCYKAAGIDLVPGKAPQEVTPADLANRIALHG